MIVLLNFRGRSYNIEANTSEDGRNLSGPGYRVQTGMCKNFPQKLLRDKVN